MLSGSFDGLVNAVRKLYLDPEFSDLKIVSSFRTYPVHKAVVCPRSPYLADKCRDPGFAAAGSTIEVKDDDPQAVHLIIEYLYNLDYTDTLPDELLHFQQINGHAVDNEGAPSTIDGFNPESPVVVTNGFDHPDSPQPAASLKETPHPENEGAPLGEEPLDDFLDIKKTPIAIKKGKKGKKGKRLSESAPPPPQEEPLTDQRQLDTPTPAETAFAATAPLHLAAPQPKLTTHAKLYSLSAKYGIAELQSLALSKFQTQAQDGWDAADFVHAAREVYSSPLLSDRSHEEMRRAVTGLVYGHRELLDEEKAGEGVKEGMRGILRGELGLDLILRFREEGAW